MIRRLLVTAIASGVVFGMAGCKHKCCRSDGSSGAAPAPFLPSGPGTTIPPAGVPVTPSTPGGGLPPPADFGAPSPSGRPAPEILTPDPLPGGPSSRSQSPSGGILGPAKPSTAAKPSTGPTLEPPIVSKPAATAANLPAAGLPGFTSVADGIATGRRPVIEGFDSLKKSGYRTVVYLHPAGADPSAVRDLAETRGFTFVAVEATPEKLADAFDQVKKATADKTARPAYVFDDDGLRAGAIWYLHFKTVEMESPEVSKIRAKALGLTDDSEFWPAIQQFVAK